MLELAAQDIEARILAAFAKAGPPADRLGPPAIWIAASPDQCRNCRLTGRRTDT